MRCIVEMSAWLLSVVKRNINAQRFILVSELVQQQECIQYIKFIFNPENKDINICKHSLYCILFITPDVNKLDSAPLSNDVMLMFEWIHRTVWTHQVFDVWAARSPSRTAFSLKIQLVRSFFLVH